MIDLKNSIYVYTYIRKISVMKKKESVTSVKIESEMWDEFKLESFKKKFTLHKLVNRTIHLYLNDPEFQSMITNYTDTDNKEK